MTLQFQAVLSQKKEIRVVLHHAMEAFGTEFFGNGTNLHVYDKCTGEALLGKKINSQLFIIDTLTYSILCLYWCKI